jgi:hypothetical protein
MNQQDTASTQATAAPAGEIPGIARVATIVPPAGNSHATGTRSTSTLLGDVVGGLLGKIAQILNPSLIDLTLSSSKKGGHYAVLAGGALTLVYAIYAAIRQNSFGVFATGVGMVVALAVAQYAAIRFLGASDNIIASTPSRVSSSAFLDCVGVLAILAAVAIVLGGIASSIVARTAVPLIPAVIMGAILTCGGAVALHPRTVNVSAGETTTAGEEAIGLLSFFFKNALKLVPLFFVLLSAAGALTLLLSFFDGGASASAAQGIINSVPMPIPVGAGLSGSALVLMGCLVPIFSYFVFLLQYLIVDVLRAILAVPNKLDSLRR